MKVFILEDEITGYRSPLKSILEAKGHKLVIATSVPDAQKKYPSLQPYDFLLLDHDMRGVFDPVDHPTCAGRFCEWLVKHPQIGKDDDPKVILHSQNERGRWSMRDILNEAGFRVKQFAYSNDYIQALNDRTLEEVFASC